MTTSLSSQPIKPITRRAADAHHRLRPWVAVVANPFSGAGRNRQLVAKLEDALAKRGLDCRVLWDPIERAAVLGDPEGSRACRCVIAAGGDGTVADVINETLDIPLAAMPIGNENLFARQFRFRRIDRLADAVVRGRTVSMDVGRAGNRRFAIMVSAGLDADVVHRLQKWRVRSGELRRVTRLSYSRPILSALAGYGYPRITLEADGRTVRGAHVMIFNMNQYACRLGFTPEADPSDGLLHWVVFEHPGAIAMGGYLLSVLLGRHPHIDSVHHGAGRFLRLTADADVPVQVDGDPSGRTPLAIELMPRALRVIDTAAD